MKKTIYNSIKVIMICSLVLLGQYSSGQVIIPKVTDTIAVINDAYSYNINASFTPDAPTYTLTQAPAWMSINASGVISGTPNSLNFGGGVVTIKAVNGAGTYYKSFNLYIRDEPACDANIIGYWPMDKKVGTTLPDASSDYDAPFVDVYSPEPAISTTAMVGNSFLFTPTNADDKFYAVTNEAPFEFSGTFSWGVSFWFKNTASSYSTDYFGEVMIGRTTTGSARWWINWNPGTKQLEAHIRDNGGDGTTVVHNTVIDDTEWHFVVLNFWSVAGTANSYIGFFIDQALTLGTYDFWTDNFTGSGKLDIGWADGIGRPYSGYLDEITFSNREYSDPENAALQAKGEAHQPACAAGNTAPLISSTAVTAATEDAAYSYQLKFRDLDGDNVTLSAISTLPSWLDFDESTGVLSGTPLNADGGNVNVSLQASDGSVDVVQSFTIAVASVNDAPVFTSTPVTAGATGTTYIYTITTTDEENQARTLSCTTKPAWLVFATDAGSGTLTGTPGNPGSYDIVLSVTDGTTAVTQPFTIAVTGVSGTDDVESNLARVYPNPASEYVKFEFAEVYKTASLKVFSLDGKILKELNINNLSSYTLELGDFKPNTYLYLITSDKGQQKGKFLVE